MIRCGVFCWLLFDYVLAADSVPGFVTDQVGNGGKVKVCRDASHQIIEIELLDYYESREYHGFPKYQFAEGDAIGKAKAAARLLRNLDQERSEWYVKEIHSFFRNTRFVTTPLVAIPDSEHIIEPPAGCQYEQVAIQLNRGFSFDKRYNIDKHLWKKLDEDNKAGLILHEVIYREAVLRGHKNSLAVRYFNALISNRGIESYGEESYSSLLSQLKLKTHVWKDPLVNREWVFLQGIEPRWQTARKACQIIAGASLAHPHTVHSAASQLINSPLFHPIYNDLYGETWTSERRIDDGLVAILIWSKSGLKTHFRREDAHANILCIRS